jgi:hypothetical protein
MSMLDREEPNATDREIVPDAAGPQVEFVKGVPETLRPPPANTCDIWSAH